MSRIWILTAMGKDQPGIVANVTKLLFELGCNLDDSAMTRLAGEFAIMVIFSVPASLSDERLRRATLPMAKRFKLVVQLKPLTLAETKPRTPAASYVISIYGADRPGIVYHVSALLAKERINITDVSTHRTGGTRRGARSLYLLLLEVELPPRLSIGRLTTRLQELAKHSGYQVSIRPVEADVL